MGKKGKGERGGKTKKKKNITLWAKKRKEEKKRKKKERKWLVICGEEEREEGKGGGGYMRKWSRFEGCGLEKAVEKMSGEAGGEEGCVFFFLVWRHWGVQVRAYGA